MQVRDFSSECPFRGRLSPADLLSSAGCDIASRRWFRTATHCLSIALLCGCTPRPTTDMDPPASAPPARLQPVDPAPETTPASIPRKAADKHGQHKSHNRTKQAEILAAVEPSALLGKEPSAVKKLLGDPADISERDVSLVWTYGSPDCAFQVYFYPDIKTSMFHALQYAATRHDGEKIELGQGCIQRLLVMRK